MTVTNRRGSTLAMAKIAGDSPREKTPNLILSQDRLSN
jgi:hypothetical protein